MFFILRCNYKYFGVKLSSEFNSVLHFSNIFIGFKLKIITTYVHRYYANTFFFFWKTYINFVPTFLIATMCFKINILSIYLYIL